MQIVVCAAKLERARALQALWLVTDRNAELVTQHIVMEQWRSYRDRSEDLGRSTQVLNRDEL